ncbi:MAG: bifunctional NUDIX hydrolase/phosphatase PAP2 family protein [Enterovibrio sp.]
MCRFLLIFTTFFFLLLPASYAQAVEINGAACFIADKTGRVVVVKDTLTKRYALPGGYIKKNETPQEGAIRETLEETGLAVEVVSELAHSNGALLFACKTKEPLAIHNESMNLALFAAWQAPFFGSEIQNAYLMRPNTELLVNSRFPEQVELFNDFAQRTPASQTIAVDDFQNLGDPLLLWSSQINSQFQELVSNLPELIAHFVHAILVYSSALGSGMLYFFLLPFALASGGLKRGAQLLCGLVLTSFCVVVIKQIGALPRPSHLFPQLLIGHDPYGYSTPSGHTATAFMLWGLIYFWLRHLGKSTTYFWIVPGVLVGLSRIYLGVHYFFDVLTGALLGIVSALLIQKIAEKNWQIRPWFWVGIGMITLASSALFMVPYLLYCTLISWTLAFVFFTKFPTENLQSTRFSPFAFIMTMAGIVITGCAFYGIDIISSDSKDILVAQSLCIVLFTVWVSVLTPRFAFR